MAKDFRAKQVRTTQVIASGSVAGKPSLLIASASSPGVNYDGGGINDTLLSNVGKDVFIFVSGTKGSKDSPSAQGVILFGGDITISGTAYNGSGNSYATVAGSNTQVQFNDGGVMGADSGLTYNKTTDTLSVGSIYVTGSTAKNGISGSLSQGLSVTATGDYSHAEGYNSTASGDGSHSEGRQNTASGYSSHAEGYLTVASGDYSHSEGVQTYAVGSYSHAGGWMTIASGTNQTAVGQFNKRKNATSLFIVGNGSGDADSDRKDIFLIDTNTVRIGSGSNLGTDVFLLVSGSAGSKGTSTKGTAVFGGDVVVSSSLHVNNNLNVTGSVIITQDLTVNGTTTTINTQNLLVKDPLIYFGSGSGGSNSDGGIALASGSSVVNKSLVWGRVDTDTWGAGILDVNSGSKTSVTDMLLTPIRASRFQVGGSNSMILNDVDMYNMWIVASTGIKVDPGNSGYGLRLGNTSSPIALSGSDIRFGNSSIEFSNEIPPQPGLDSFFFVSGSIGSRGTSSRGTAVFGGDVVISGALYQSNSVPITGTFNEPAASKFVTTASVSLAGGQGFTYTADSIGSDTYFYVSGSKSGRGTSSGKVATFGGVSVVSGAFYALDSVNTPYIKNDSFITMRVSGQDLGYIQSDGLALNSNKYLYVGGLYVSSTADGRASLYNAKALTFSGQSVSNVADQFLDTFLFVSGTPGSKDSSTRGTTVFGGDVVISGTLHGGSPLKIGSPVQITGYLNNLMLGASSKITRLNDTSEIGFSDDGVVRLNPSDTSYRGTIEIAKGDSTYLFISQTNGSGDSCIATLIPGTSAASSLLGITGYQGNNLTAAGSDTFFYVSGSVGSRNTNTRGSSVFGGDVVVSGTIYDKNGNPYSAGGGGGSSSGTFNEPAPSKFVTTASVSLAGGQGFTYTADSVGSDTYFFVSGAMGSKDTTTAGVATFGGDVVISGNLHGGSPLKIVSDVHLTGSLNLSNGSDITSEDGTARLTLVNGGYARINHLNSFEFYKDYFTYLYVSQTNATSGGSIATLRTLGLLGITSIAGSNMSNAGSDAFFYVSGSVGSKDTFIRGTSVFGGDVVISGTIYDGSGNSYSTGGGGGGGISYFNSNVAGSIYTTGSAAFKGSEVGIDTPSIKGTDVFFYVSGSVGSKSGATQGVSMFGGDLQVSGGLYQRNLTIDTALNGSNATLDDVSVIINLTDGNDDSYRLKNKSTGKTYQSINTNARVMGFGVASSDGELTSLTDSWAFFSGSIGSKNTANKGGVIFGGDITVSGSMYLDSGANLASGSHVLPTQDLQSNLGSPSNRFGNIYTGDLHLRNDRGDWTIVEEEDYLCVVNNKTGKKFKMALIPMEE